MIQSINPATNEQIKEYKSFSDAEVEKRLAIAQTAFASWKKTSFETRKKLFQQVAKHLLAHKQEFAEIITSEMGKPIVESVGEVEKCALVCNYFADNAEKFLKSEDVKTEAKKSYVAYEPLGIIFAIMPWNFPFWQVFRYSAPALMAGNVTILKHASNVSGCSLAVEEIFAKCGFPTGVFQSVLVAGHETEKIIRDPRIQAITLTGSDRAGATVAKIAGEVVKKTVLELGGSDPFIVMDDADLEKVSSMAAVARTRTAGQVCICAKRFIVHEKVYDKFVKLFKEKMEKIIVGDPLDPKTEMGPLSSESILKTLDEQVKKSVEMGAKLILGGKRPDRKGAFYMPTILTDVTKGMPAYDEETFGPVAAVIKCTSAEDALNIANDTKYGLGASVWTKDKKTAEFFVNGIEAGTVFVNQIVRSDPRLPIGGTKASGYGRELSSFGIKEFVNVKAVWME